MFLEQLCIVPSDAHRALPWQRDCEALARERPCFVTSMAVARPSPSDPFPKIPFWLVPRSFYCQKKTYCYGDHDRDL